jgi:hypothetical protein
MMMSTGLAVLNFAIRAGSERKDRPVAAELIQIFPRNSAPSSVIDLSTIVSPAAVFVTSPPALRTVDL